MEMNYFKKTGKMMVAACMLAGLPFIPGTVSASELQTQMMSVQMESTTLKELFDLIEEKFNYTFLIRNNDINLNERISIDMSNRSVEEILKGGDWSWSVAANLGLNRNKITELYGGKSEIITSNAGSSYAISMDKILTPGQDVDTWYGTEWAGVDPETGSPLWYTTNENGERVTTSNYSDASKHQTIIGKLSPDFYGGFSTDLSWKNIDLSAVFGYSVGGDIYNYDRSMYDSDGAYVNYNQMNLKEGWNRWEKPGDIATHPKAEYGNKSQSSKGSSRYLEDASYLRLRSLTLGYTLPWKIQYVDNIRLSFSGENLFVLSGFSGVDPELPAEVGNKYKAGSVGVAISPYPQARKFMFGLNVTF